MFDLHRNKAKHQCICVALKSLILSYPEMIEDLGKFKITVKI